MSMQAYLAGRYGDASASASAPGGGGGASKKRKHKHKHKKKHKKSRHAPRGAAATSARASGTIIRDADDVGGAGGGFDATRVEDAWGQLEARNEGNDGPVIVDGSALLRGSAGINDGNGAAKKASAPATSGGTWGDASGSDSGGGGGGSGGGSGSGSDSDSNDASPPRRAAAAEPRRRRRFDSSDDEDGDGGGGAGLLGAGGGAGSDSDADAPRRQAAPARRRRFDSSGDEGSDGGGGNGGNGGGSGSGSGSGSDSDANVPRRRGGGGGSGSDSGSGSGSGSDSDVDAPRRRPRAGSGGSDAQPAGAKAKKAKKKKKKKEAKRMMFSGGTAGLHSGASFAEEQKRVQAQKKARAGEEDGAAMGQGAATVYRDKRGRKLDMLNEFMNQQAARDGREAKQQALNYEWGTGKAQREAKEREAARLAQEGAAPFARSKNDAALNDVLKDRVRADDPMARYMAQKRAREGTGGGGGSAGGPPGRPTYSGPPPPINRFGLKPGYRWDGVARGNGFEARLIRARNDRKAKKSAYRPVFE